MAGRNMPSLSGAEQCAAEAHNACLLFAGSPRKKKERGKKKRVAGVGGKGEGSWSFLAGPLSRGSNISSALTDMQILASAQQ